MKFSDFSIREYVALEVFPHLVGHVTDREAAWRAFGMADAFLKQAGKEDDRIKQAEARAKLAETQAEVLRDYVFVDENGNTIVERVALTELWNKLGARNQTEAMQKLAELLP